MRGLVELIHGHGLFCIDNKTINKLYSLYVYIHKRATAKTN